jgi:hypothetical protein
MPSAFALAGSVQSKWRIAAKETVACLIGLHGCDPFLDPIALCFSNRRQDNEDELCKCRYRSRRHLWFVPKNSPDPYPGAAQRTRQALVAGDPCPQPPSRLIAGSPDGCPGTAQSSPDITCPRAPSARQRRTHSPVAVLILRTNQRHRCNERIVRSDLMWPCRWPVIRWNA